MISTAQSMVYVTRHTAYALAFLLLVTSYLLLVTTSHAASLSLSPSAGTFNPGCDVKLNIMLNTEGAQTDGVDAILSYDPTRLSAKKINNGVIYSEYPGNIIDPQAGQVIISGSASSTSPFAGSGALASVDFMVLSTAPDGVTQVKFDFDPSDRTKTTDSNVAERNNISDVLSSVTDGSYTIGTGTACTGGSAVGSTGTVSTPSATPIKTLPVAADINSTMVLAVAGSLLTILGILGLAFL